MRFIALLFILMVTMAIREPVHVPDRIIRSEPTPLEKFLDHMAARESNNTPTVVNRFGMMGKYQFDPNTVRKLGFHTSQREFLANPELQDSVMVAYMRANNSDLKRIIERYEGKTFKGIRVTRAGILAAAHLGGSGSIRHFFSSDDPNGRADANGTSIRDYMTEFSRHSIGEVF